MIDWQPIKTIPTDGTRVRVGHIRDASSMKDETIFPVTAVVKDGKFISSAFFVCDDRSMREIPTHWRPVQS